MPDQRYEANRQTIGGLLSTTSPRIEVPEWQRSYSWGVGEVETFWQDVVSFSHRYPEGHIEGEEYFLGSIVLVTGGPKNQLLDGQQRLATATILLAALRDACRSHKADAATRLQNKYICDFDDLTNAVTPVFTLNIYDRSFFREEIQNEPSASLARPTPTLGSHKNIRRAREFFENEIAAQNVSVGGGQAAFAWNLRIADVLCNHMSVVAVSSTDEDNAAAVFETLNDRGIGLSTPDLLRNLLLRRAEHPASRDRVVEAWLDILEIHEEASVDEFLRHYWISHRGDVKARGLYREIKSTVLEEELDSEELSVDLAGTASVYRDIRSARAASYLLTRSLQGMRDLGSKVLYPAMLSGYAAVEGDESSIVLESFAETLVALYVRYNVIGGRETTILESKIYEVSSALRKTQDFENAMSQVSALAPPAEEFVAQFRQASIPRMATARYLLRTIEHAMRSTDEVVVENTDRVHVEHIYPKTPAGEKWSDHSELINRLGNMTLLGKKLNTSIKNADFQEKKARAYSTSQIVLTQELLEVEIWDRDAIDERQCRLSEYALDIWRMPNE